MHFFAIQASRFDTHYDIAEMLLRKADELGFRCTSLEVLDQIEIGSTSYLRCRSDLVQVVDVLNALYSPKRAVVLPSGTTYLAKVNGREGPIPFSKMQTVPRIGATSFRGNAAPHWERQFLKDKQA